MTHRTITVFQVVNIYASRKGKVAPGIHQSAKRNDERGKKSCVDRDLYQCGTGREGHVALGSGLSFLSLVIRVSFKALTTTLRSATVSLLRVRGLLLN